MIHKLKDKYLSLSQPARASLWFLICGFLQKGISFLTTPVFTRVMTEAQYGSFSVYNSWLSIVQIIVSLNLAAGVYTRGLVKNEEDQNRFSSAMLGLSTTCMAVGWVIYALLHKQINAWLGLSTGLMAAMFLEIWGTAAYQFWSNRERVHYRYKKLAALTVLYVLLRPVLGVIFVLLVQQEHQMYARVAAAVLSNTVLFTGLYITITKKGKTFFHKEYWVYALKFNLPLLPHYLSQIVLNQSDRVMIDYFCGEEQAAYYSVAYTLAMVLLILNNSVSGTMNPWIYKSIRDGKTKQIGKVSYGILFLIAVSNILVVTAAPELMLLLAPESYQSAIWVIPPVTASVYFMFLYNLFATFEYYFEKTHYVMAASVVGAVLNVILNAVFIPMFGFVAAGYTTLACYMIYAFAHYLFMNKVCRRYLPGEKIYDVRIILLLGAGLLLSVAAVTLFYRQPLIRYAIVAVIALALFIKRKSLLKLLETTRKH